MNATSKKVVVIQGNIAPYRVPLFEMLAKKVDLTVIHSGSKLDGTTFSQVHIPAFSFFGFMLQLGLRRQIRMSDPDTVIAMFDIRWPSFLTLFFRRRHSIILWGHRYGKRALVNRLRTELMRHADGNLLYGAEDVDRMVENGLARDKMFFAYNTIVVTNSEDLSEQRKDRFLFVGRLQKRKKIDALLTAFSKALVSFDSDVILEIIGDGEERENLFALAETLGIADRVTFSGSVHDNERLKSSFSKAYAYVSPGAVGLSVLHSFSYGVPVVTLRNEYHGPEFHNLRDRENSLILECEEELHKAMVKLQSQHDTRVWMSRNAFETYQQERSPERMVSGFLSAIDNGAHNA